MSALSPQDPHHLTKICTVQRSQNRIEITNNKVENLFKAKSKFSFHPAATFSPIPLWLLYWEQGDLSLIWRSNICCWQTSLINSLSATSPLQHEKTRIHSAEWTSVALWSMNSRLASLSCTFLALRPISYFYTFSLHHNVFHHCQHHHHQAYCYTDVKTPESALYEMKSAFWRWLVHP